MWCNTEPLILYREYVVTPLHVPHQEVSFGIYFQRSGLLCCFQLVCIRPYSIALSFVAQILLLRILHLYIQRVASTHAQSDSDNALTTVNYLRWRSVLTGCYCIGKVLDYGSSFNSGGTNYTVVSIHTSAWEVTSFWLIAYKIGDHMTRGYVFDVFPYDILSFPLSHLINDMNGFPQWTTPTFALHAFRGGSFDPKISCFSLTRSQIYRTISDRPNLTNNSVQRANPGVPTGFVQSDSI